MANVGYATLGIIPSAKGLGAALEKQTNGEISKAGKTAGSRYANEFKSSFGGLIAGAAIIGAFTDIISRASAAEQSVGGVQAVFGKYADKVVQDSERADQALGLSANSYRELVTLSGALLKNKGLEDFAEQAESLVQIGADLAARFGGSTKQAVEALNSALRGESDPIERYAISLNETAVAAQLAATGQKGLTGAALEQAKTQARLALILKQSADAQGAFADESDTAAGSAARTAAQWENMRQELGDKLLPAYAAFTNFLNNEGLPALESVGGVVADAGRAFGDLPAPVKAATGAIVAFRIAQAVGITAQAEAGVGRLRTGFEGLRTRTDWFQSAYTNARSTVFQFGTASGQASGQVARLTATMQGLRAASMGAGAGLRRSLGGALALVGGPWGVAFAAGTVALTHFWRENQRAKARVEELTATLDKQTGSLTASSREFVANELLQSKTLDSANKLGISLATVTDAALGQAGAMKQLQTQLAGIIAAGTTRTSSGQDVLTEKAEAASQLANALVDANGVVQQSVTRGQLLAEAMGDSATETDKAKAATSTYKTEIDKARAAVQGLLDKENERLQNNRSAFSDQTRIAAAFADARKEAAEGAKGLDLNTEAGRANRDALAALADQWSSSSDKVKNAKGAFENFRAEFVKVAEQMGASKTKAEELANRLLGIPNNKPVKVSTPGMDKALADLKKLNEELRLARLGAHIQITAQGLKNRGELADARGQTTTQQRTTTNGPGVYIDKQYVTARDYDDWLRQQQEAKRRAMSDGVSR